MGLYFENASLKQKKIVDDAVPTDNAVLDAKFTEIYENLEIISTRYRTISDTHIRIQHYTKPHTTYQDLCPECGDLWGKKKEDVVFLPTDRLNELREIERITLGLPKEPEEPEEPEPPINVVDELESILLLIKSHASFAFTLMQTEAHTNHYAKKHKHDIPGWEGLGNCPECIELLKRQTTPTQPISKKQYEELLKIESKFKNDAN